MSVWVGRVATVTAVAAIAALTALSRPEPVAPRSLWCLLCLPVGGRVATDVALNVLLYIPLGAGLHLSGLSPRRAFLFVLLLTVAIESLQSAVITGRYASLFDVAANAFGGALGILAVARWRVLLRPTTREARLLLICGTAAVIGWVVVTGWALRPAIPLDEYETRLQSATGRPQGSPWRLVGAFIDDRPVPSGTVDEPAALVRRLLDGGRVHLVLSREPAPDPRLGRARLRLVSRRQGAVVTLGEDGRDLIFRVDMRGREARIGYPSLRVPDALGRDNGSGGSEVHVTGRIAAGALRLDVDTGGRRATHELPLSPLMGWTLLLPFGSITPTEARTLTGAWILLTLLPLSYWAARAASSRRRSLLTVLLLGGTFFGALALTALKFGFPLPRPLEWTAVASALALGAVVARRVSHRNVARPPEAST